MRLNFFLLVCAAALLPQVASANELLRVYDLARQNDTTLQASAAQRDSALEAEPQARAALLPQISAGYQRGREHANSHYTSFGTHTDDYLNDGLQVTLNQAIFDGHAFEQLRQADDLDALAVANYNAAEQGLVLRVAQAYFNVLSAADQLRASQALSKSLESQLEQAKQSFQVGLAAITDMQSAQAGYDTAAAQVIADQQALDSARYALTQITNTPDVKIATLQDDIPLPSPDPANADAWVAAAKQHNFDLLGAELQAAAAKKGIRAAWARHLPTLGFQAQYTDGEQGGPLGAKQRTSTALFQISLPIFSGGATQSGVRQAEYNYDQQQALLEGERRAVESQTRIAFLGVLSGAARVKALKQAVLSNKTSVEASETGMQVGTRTIVDVLTAQQLLYSAQRDYLQSRYAYLISVLSLKADAGRLTERDLADVDKLLTRTD
ncbi:MAG TPA: TolC family outer membrane protein [Stenotrophobium sp.]|jgi:outer membrane protein|nr:TolC family outer membrane protein [Stenotrophobium sp.]